MFKSATLRLTLWYVAIVMMISGLFSIVVYQASARELHSSLRRQAIVLRQLPYYQSGQGPDLDSLPEEQFVLAITRIKTNLVLLNLSILVLSGVASYAMARRTLQPIEDALEAQSRFTADASHELRTPLTAMRTEVEVALRDSALQLPEAKKLLFSNLEEINKLEALASSLLALARHDSNDLPWGTVQLVRVVDQAVDRLAKVIIQRKIKLEVKIGKHKVTGNEDALTELVVILLDNAIKYSDPGKLVAITSTESGGQVSLVVRDQGQGIKASDLPYIFERFYRADSSRSKSQIEGYGLGLAIAQKIVDTHSGTIEVDSTPGNGATFTVRLPKAS